MNEALVFVILLDSFILVSPPCGGDCHSDALLTYMSECLKYLLQYPKVSRRINLFVNIYLFEKGFGSVKRYLSN